MYIHIYVPTHVRAHMCVYPHRAHHSPFFSRRAYTHIHVCTCVHIHVYIQMYTCTFKISTYTCTCINVCIYTWSTSSTWQWCHCRPVYRVYPVYPTTLRWCVSYHSTIPKGRQGYCLLYMCLIANGREKRERERERERRELHADIPYEHLVRCKSTKGILLYICILPICFRLYFPHLYPILILHRVHLHI